jgi:hypothetical protein
MVGCSGRGELACLLYLSVFVFWVKDRIERVVAEVAAADEPLVSLKDRGDVNSVPCPIQPSFGRAGVGC